MKNLVINSQKELKLFLEENRKSITNINGVEFDELYPIISVTNKHTSYYDVDSQGNIFLFPPYVIKTK